MVCSFLRQANENYRFLNRIFGGWIVVITNTSKNKSCLHQGKQIVSINNQLSMVGIVNSTTLTYSLCVYYCGTASSMPTETLLTRPRKHWRKSNSSYDTQIVKDPRARQSTTIKRANFSDKHMHGDNDCWREGVFCSTRIGKPSIFFISENTGQQVRDEPPTAASEVLYLLDAVREKRLNVCLR